MHSKLWLQSPIGASWVHFGAELGQKRPAGCFAFVGALGFAAPGRYSLEPCQILFELANQGLALADCGSGIGDSDHRNRLANEVNAR